MALHRESAVFGDIILQIGLINALEQFFKSLGRKIRQHQQHPLTGTQPDIGLGQRSLVAGEQHPAVLHPDIFHIHSLQFVTRQTFQAEQAGYRKFKFRHSSSISNTLEAHITE